MGMTAGVLSMLLCMFNTLTVRKVRIGECDVFIEHEARGARVMW